MCVRGEGCEGRGRGGGRNEPELLRQDGYLVARSHELLRSPGAGVDGPSCSLRSLGAGVDGFSASQRITCSIASKAVCCAADGDVVPEWSA